MRLAISILLTAALWMLLPFALEVSSMDTLTRYGLGRLFEDLPAYIAKWYGMFLIIAAAMHLLFAKFTLRLGRIEFFVFPLISLLCASVAFIPVWYITDEGMSSDWFYQLYWVLAVVFFHMVWITYPLALANQWLIRELLLPPVASPASTSKCAGFLDRAVGFLKKRI